MCDTIVTAGTAGKSLFAKNSDREPGEPQMVYYSADPGGDFRGAPWLERRAKYADHSYPALAAAFDEFENPFTALVCRPSWMWGAEMGVNERGLAVGNEAVFSRQKVPRDGILGMDILRLTLHNAASAREGLLFITGLLERHEQGGDGGYNGVLKYHNSFLLKDSAEAYVLETAGRHWAARRVSTASISNAYTIRGIRDGADKGSRNARSFKRRYEDPVYTLFSRGNDRQRFTSSAIARDRAGLPALSALLRSHAGRDPALAPRRGMGCICMHSGRLIHSETTSSMIVDYAGEKVVAWLTSSPHPCVSLFTPAALQPDGAACRLLEPAGALEHARRQAMRAAATVAHWPLFVKSLMPLRDEYEREFARIVSTGITDKSEEQLAADCRRCQDLAEEYGRTADAVLSRA